MVGGLRDPTVTLITLTSGVGIIIGQRTKKILHMSVKNKYCASCAAGSPRDKHHCYKNWDESSSAMETQAILEGFQQSEQVHGLRYTSFIGDGDSSVYPTLIQQFHTFTPIILFTPHLYGTSCCACELFAHLKG